MSDRSLPSNVVLTEISEGHRLLGSLFQRKFGAPPPVSPHHLLALHVPAEGGAIQVCSYAHFNPFGDVCLVGGVCTDGAVLRSLDNRTRDGISAAGGLYYHLLRFGFRKFADDFAAFLGYCGDARALEVNLAAGFERTEYDYLLFHAPRALPALHRRALIAKGHAIGPF